MRITCYNEHLSVTGWQLANVLVFGRGRWRCPTLGRRIRADVGTVRILMRLFAHRSIGRRAGGLAHSREGCGNFSRTQVECGEEKGIQKTEYGIQKTEYGI